MGLNKRNKNNKIEKFEEEMKENGSKNDNGRI